MIPLRRIGRSRRDDAGPGTAPGTPGNDTDWISFRPTPETEELLGGLTERADADEETGRDGR
ncbi:hypothetical protein DPM19_09290 [Actinomadura craniellae]|uniref:Uncharacterized protein n=1 Tax=Actinomadura craniellae TaxID=2231787 RepID=A0A365HCD6_9ACTN|nr:hypothetical protein DPM19_09290 [Actinomadura craniellae]